MTSLLAKALLFTADIDLGYRIFVVAEYVRFNDI